MQLPSALKKHGLWVYRPREILGTGPLAQFLAARHEQAYFAIHFDKIPITKTSFKFENTFIFYLVLGANFGVETQFGKIQIFGFGNTVKLVCNYTAERV